MYTDPTGCFPILIALILGAFAVAGMVTGGVVAHNQGKTGWEVFGYVMLGGAIGLAAGGLVVATAGAGASIFGATGLATPFLGVTAYQAFAIGALAYNFFAFVVSPIIGVTVDGIETISDGDTTTVPKPGKTPRHFANGKSALFPNRVFGKKISLFNSSYLMSRIGKRSYII